MKSGLSGLCTVVTQAEGIKLCAQTFGKDVAKLSCCGNLADEVLLGMT